MRIYAHRGASGEFTEGSEAAYLAAVEQGADGFECDVRLTKDKQIICYHDSNAKRLSKLDFKVADKDYAELRQSINPFRLDQLLDLAILNQKDLLIESKHPVPSGGEIEKQIHKLLATKMKQIEKSGIQVFYMDTLTESGVRVREYQHLEIDQINRFTDSKVARCAVWMQFTHPLATGSKGLIS